MGYTEKVVVIGAGISGLACAYRLKQFGLEPRVLEASDRAGGLIATIRRNGFIFEAGPQCPRFPSSVWRLVCDLSLESEFATCDPKARRYVLRQGRLHPAPFSPMSLIATRLVGLRSKLRILAEPFRYSQPPDWEESLADFVERKFGAEVLDILVDPFVSTIFFGNAREMGMRSAFPSLVEWERRCGSLLRGAIRARKSRREASRSDGSAPSSGAKSGSPANRNGLYVTDALPALGSFKSGMAALPEKLAEELKTRIKYSVQVTSVTPLLGDNLTSKRGWRVRLASGEQITAECVVLATPAHVAAGLLATSVRPVASQLHAIEHVPACTVSCAYRRSEIANCLDGFGFVVPRREGLRTICTFWNSSLLRERAPGGVALITSFARWEGNPGCERLTDEDVAKAIEAENARILGISGKPLDRMVWKHPRALPQYNVGHASRVAEIYGVLHLHPNLYLVGNYLSGRSIGDCVDMASRVAEDLHSRLQRPSI